MKELLTVGDTKSKRRRQVSSSNERGVDRSRAVTDFPQMGIMRVR